MHMQQMQQARVHCNPHHQLIFTLSLLQVSADDPSGAASSSLAWPPAAALLRSSTPSPWIAFCSHCSRPSAQRSQHAKHSKAIWRITWHCSEQQPLANSQPVTSNSHGTL
jgi:hypothetical protein